MSEFPECMKRRGDEGDEHRNGQVCHRIAEHYGSCLFDRPAEFDPVREEARPLPKRSVYVRSGALLTFPKR